MQGKGGDVSPIKETHLTALQYGNVFTFVLFGRQMTVALGPTGNNFILGAKPTVFAAEEAYTVIVILVYGTVSFVHHFIAPHDSSFRKGCRI